MIFVTGGAGYIGSHTVRSLLAAGHSVTVFDRFPKGTETIPPGVVTVRGDLADLELLIDSLKQSKADAVFHFAGYIAAGESMQNPTKFFRNNISNSVNLLDAIVQSDVKKIIFSSSAGVYGDPEKLPIPEDHPCRPTSTYGETKYFFERMLDWYDRIHGIRSICLRYFNAAGAHPSGEIGESHDPESHLIPLALDAVIGLRKELQLFGDDYPTRDGTCVRDYIHVVDLADAHVLALQALDKGCDSSIYNLGTGNGYSNLEVLKTIEEVTGKPVPYRVVGRREGDPSELYASSDRAERELGWTPKYQDLRTIIETAWTWHQKLRGISAQ